jgi:hypothetical protein
MLLECQGRIVTREEIKRRLWTNNTVVDFDQSIMRRLRPYAVPWGIQRITLGTSRPWDGVAIG